jgi:hypothetical protein
MAAHTGDPAGSPDLSIILQSEMTALAAHARAVHEIGHRRNALSPDAGVQVALRRVAGSVASGALRLGRLNVARGNVFDLLVTVHAIDLVIGNVHLVHQMGLAVLRQPLRIVMTDEAAFLRHAALGV